MFMHRTISRGLTGTIQQIHESTLAVLGDCGNKDSIKQPTELAKSDSYTQLGPKAPNPGLLHQRYSFQKITVADKYAIFREQIALTATDED